MIFNIIAIELIRLDQKEVLEEFGIRANMITPTEYHIRDNQIISINTPEEMIKLSDDLEEELIIGGTVEFPILEIYNGSRE
jgi:hypothetical protein